MKQCAPYSFVFEFLTPGENEWLKEAMDSDWELKALVAQAANWAAKVGGISWDYDGYSLKESLLTALLREAPSASTKYHEGVVYFETRFGQLSYHIFDSLDLMWYLKARVNMCPWSSINLQCRSHDILIEVAKTGFGLVFEDYYEGVDVECFRPGFRFIA